MLIKIKAERLFKKYNKNIVFKDISFSITSPVLFAVTGDNGAGKSTLLEIIAGIQKPTAGQIIYEIDGIREDSITIQEKMGFSSPKINPYSELSAIENLHFVYRNKNESVNIKYLTENLKISLEKFNLYNDRNKQVKYFSSGMIQRLRLMFAIIHNPHILILDEPGSNLDSGGKDLIYNYIESVRKQKIIIIATNQNEEARLCDVKINLGQGAEEFAQGLQS